MQLNFAPVNMTSYTAQQIAERFGLQLHGAGDTVIQGVACAFAHAGPGQLSFLADPRLSPPQLVTIATPRSWCCAPKSAEGGARYGTGGPRIL